MGKGLLASWRRRIVARGLAGAALFAVPVVVAALIGFGGGFAGVAGGLSSVTSVPDAVPVAAQAGPNKLNHVVVALASKRTGPNGASPSGGNAGRGSTGGGTNTTSGGSGGGGGNAGSGGSGGSTRIPTVDTPPTPNVNLPGSDAGGPVGGATNAVNGTV